MTTPATLEDTLRELEQGTPVERLFVKRFRAAQVKTRPLLKAHFEALFNDTTQHAPGGLQELVK